MSVAGSFCLIFSFGAMIMDLKWEKVCNFWNYGSWITVLLGRGILEGGSGCLGGLAGTAVVIIVLFPLFLGKMLGTGDIKVFAVLGSAMGAKSVCYCIAFSFLLGALISLPILLFRCNVRERFAYFFTYLRRVLETRTFSAYLVPGSRPENIHFTIPIFISVVLFCAGGYL